MAKPSKYFRFESADVQCNQCHKFLNTLKKENKESDNKYAWLEKYDEK